MAQTTNACGVTETTDHGPGPAALRTARSAKRGGGGLDVHTQRAFRLRPRGRCPADQRVPVGNPDASCISVRVRRS